MFLDPFYTEQSCKVTISRQQASDFAKRIADDFNPLHDVDAKRFCVPGDLLFALVLRKCGLSQRMQFNFLDMVGDNVSLTFPNASAQQPTVTDDAGKSCLSFVREGETTTDPELIDSLTRSYVAFSGHTFPDILTPLMRTHNVMINPDRPLVIYERMALDLTDLAVGDAQLESTDATLESNGRRGNVRLQFHLKTADRVIGTGEKNMVLAGLRPYDQAKIDDMIERYTARKQTL